MSCPHDPKQTTGPIGMYHCPECGEMVLAGMDHPDYSLLEKEDQEFHESLKAAVEAKPQTMAETLKTIESWKPIVESKVFIPMQEHLPPEGPLGDQKWPLFQVVGCKDRYLVYAEIDGYGEPQLLSALPDLGRRERYCTWLEWEISEWGSLGGIMALNLDGDHVSYSDDDWTWWALREGLCPGQVIIVDITASYSKDYDWYSGGYEYDFNVDWEIIARQHLPLAEHSRRWTEAFEEFDRLWTSRNMDPIMRDFL